MACVGWTTPVDRHRGPAVRHWCAGCGMGHDPCYLTWSRQWMAQAVRVLRPGGALLVYGSPERLWIPPQDHRGGGARPPSSSTSRGCTSRAATPGCAGCPSTRCAWSTWRVRQAWGGACVQRRGWRSRTRGGEGGGARQGRGRVTSESSTRSPRATGGTSRRTPLQGAAYGTHPSMKPSSCATASSASTRIRVDDLGAFGADRVRVRRARWSPSSHEKRSNTTSRSAACGAGSDALRARQLNAHRRRWVGGVPAASSSRLGTNLHSDSALSQA